MTFSLLTSLQSSILCLQMVLCVYERIQADIDTRQKGVVDIDTRQKLVADIDTQQKAVADIGTQEKVVTDTDTQQKVVADTDTQQKVVADTGTLQKAVADIDTLRKVVASRVDKVTMNTTYKLYICRKNFLSVAFGYTLFLTNFRKFDIDSKRIQNLALALAPSTIRIGGTSVDFMTFDPEEKAANMEEKPKAKRQIPDQPYFKNFIMTGAQLLRMASFCNKSGWDIVLDLNLLARDGSLWNSTNTEQLLNFSAAHRIPIVAFQLGNEVDDYLRFNRTIGAKTLIRDLKVLQGILYKHEIYKESKLLAPELTRLLKNEGTTYMTRFLEQGGCDAVSELTFHQYYMDGKTARARDFLKPSIMNLLEKELKLARHLKRKFACDKPYRITETASCWGGGAPDISDRFTAGFLWLDKLGLAARYKVTIVNRQTFFGANYGLLTRNDAMPTPCYYLSVLFKRLVEGPVFKVRTPSDDLRVYANCASPTLYPHGAVVIYYVNVRKEDRIVSLPQFKNQSMHIYILTAGDEDGLESSYVKLNGRILDMVGDTLPEMKPQEVTDVTVAPQSYGFIVVPQARVHLCSQFFQKRLTTPGKKREGTERKKNSFKGHNSTRMMMLALAFVVLIFHSFATFSN